MTITTAMYKGELISILKSYMTEANPLDITTPSVRDACWTTLGNMGVEAIREDLEEFKLSAEEEIALVEKLKDEIYDTEIEDVSFSFDNDPFESCVDIEVVFSCDIEEIIYKVREPLKKKDSEKSVGGER